MRICLDKDGVIAEWVKRQIPVVPTFGNCNALGLLDQNGAPLAGAVYHDYQPQWGSIMISFAAASPKWATPQAVQMFLAYPFQQLGVHKLRAAAEHDNERSLKLINGIGFVREAVLKDEFGKGKNAVLFRMFERDFTRLYTLKGIRSGEKGRKLSQVA